MHPVLEQNNCACLLYLPVDIQINVRNTNQLQCTLYWNATTAHGNQVWPSDVNATRNGLCSTMRQNYRSTQLWRRNRSNDCQKCCFTEDQHWDPFKMRFGRAENHFGATIQSWDLAMARHRNEIEINRLCWGAGWADCKNPLGITL